MNDVLKALAYRRSVRRFSDLPLDSKTMDIILEAGMRGPSCVNSKDWYFLVVTDKAVLNKMADVNGKPAEPLRSAQAGVLVCGDLQRAFPKAPDYWVIDGAIAIQNMILAAYSLGVGSVWLGTWPQEARVAGQKELFGLPEYVVPHSILALGYPEDTLDKETPAPFDPERVHYNKW